MLSRRAGICYGTAANARRGDRTSTVSRSDLGAMIAALEASGVEFVFEDGAGAGHFAWVQKARRVAAPRGFERDLPRRFGATAAGSSTTRAVERRGEPCLDRSLAGPCTTQIIATWRPSPSLVMVESRTMASVAFSEDVPDEDAARGPARPAL